jgi:glycosyltransferase involved in cell wall biosynthesis
VELNLNYVHGAEIGYGRYGVELAKALTNLGVDVYDHLPAPEDGPPRWGDQDHLNTLYSKVCNVVCWISVPTHATGWWKGQVPIMSTMWEATRLPESFRETMHEFETMIVPSIQNLELFSKFHDNVKLVPLGVDPERWHYQERQKPGQFFDFLIAGSGPRKGTDLAHLAFRKLWGKAGSWGTGPIPRLVMKNPRGEYFHGERIEVVGGRISAEAEVDLYARAHCYLQPSRGEGFGLQPLQALAQGCPTILTDAHGHEIFAHLGYGLSTSMSPSAYFIYGDAGEWWEPSFSQLCEYMEFVYHNYPAACAEAKESAEFIAKTFTWKNTAEKFIEAIGKEALDLPGPTAVDWYLPVQQRYFVQTVKDWACDIAGTHYQFKREQKYYVWADVKRILYEAELLDPVCLSGDDPGLAPAQLERLPDYSADHSACALCGQLLGGPTRADAIFEELNRPVIGARGLES